MRRTIGITVTLGVMTLGAAGAAVAGPAADTVRGTAGDDKIVGTERGDRINGLGGDDVLIGRLGNDSLMGGRGDDVVRGQNGVDTLNGFTGDDVLWGGPRGDEADDGHGSDLLILGRGADSVHTEPDGNTDRIRCGPGNDHVWYWGEPEARDILVDCEHVGDWSH